MNQARRLRRMDHSHQPMMMAATSRTRASKTGSKMARKAVTPDRMSSPVLTMGLAVPAVVAVITGSLFFKHRRDMSLSTRGTQRWKDFKGFVRSEAIATNIMIGVAGASAVTTIILFVLKPDDAGTKTLDFGE